MSQKNAYIYMYILYVYFFLMYIVFKAVLAHFSTYKMHRFAKKKKNPKRQETAIH